MSQHLTAQLDLQRIIERYLENFKKIGKNNLTPAKIRSRISCLKENWTLFRNGHSLLTTTTPATEQAALSYFKDRCFETTHASYLAALDYMSECLEALEPYVNSDQTLNESKVRPEASAFSLSHLPPIQLPPFDGKYDEWEQFRDRFTALIRDNNDLTDFTRMHFLASCLRGRALECIANISVTADNFEIAWQALISRYENKQRSLHVHLSKLLNLSAMTRESASELQTLHDQVNLAVSSLTNLNRTPEELWNDTLVHLIVQKLDPVTRKAWNFKESDKATPPSYDDLRRFLQNRASALENSAVGSGSKTSSKASASSHVHIATTAHSQTKCPLCQASHFINKCSTFVSMNPSQRRDIVKKYKRCFNCLSDKHSVTECKSKYSCRVCREKHHSMLHYDSGSESSSSKIVPSNCSPPKPSEEKTEIHSLQSSIQNRSQVLLATAWVTVRVPSGRTAVVRALLDQGSEMTFVSENLAQILRAKRIRMPVSVTAVGGIHAGTFRHATRILISPRNNLNPSFSTTALILDALTSYIPKRNINISSLSQFSNLPWADADPTSPEPIDIIIGADLYNDIIIDGIRKGGIGQPLAQNSVLGWIISGPVGPTATSSRFSTNEHSFSCSPSSISAHHLLCSPSLDEALRHFWEVEELPRQSILTPQESQSEEHFCSTYSRDVDGRYVVRLPFKKPPPLDIGNSKLRAEQVLNTVIRKLSDKPDEKKEYREFLAEYEKLGHMRQTSMIKTPSRQFVYLPHHGVIRESSSTTRLRVVFNASSVTSNGTSLNDHLHAGPKLQTDITSVILQWRRYKYVYSSDIAKMYRQIRVDERDINYQRILWKSSPSDAIREYQLLTVTYGMSCAPFLALRVLRQLIADEGQHFPLAVPILRDNIYVDDILFGADNMTLIRQSRDQLNSLLKRGGFELRKWASNSPALLKDIDTTHYESARTRSFDSEDQIKILGIGWNPESDSFVYSIFLESPAPASKRSILSAIAKLFDPLGWVTPVTITAKALMQQLWKVKIGWDDALSEPLVTKWRDISSRLAYLRNIKIPRWCGLGPETNHAEIHGFSDASNSAYAAAVYIKIVSSSGQVSITLLAGKSKVAPLKPLSIPRLELSAALLLARLVEFVRASSGYRDYPYFCWTDSTIVFAWVTQHPSRWKTFVANRVSEIQSLLPNAEWRHVSSEDNPADCASRGMFGDEIINHELWWHGPSWLRSDSAQWPRTDINLLPGAPLEERFASLQCVQKNNPWDLASKYSSWPKLIRVTGYVIKFLRLCHRDHSCREPSSVLSSPTSSQLPAPNSIALSSSDCTRAKIFWIKRIQVDVFPIELNALLKNRSLSSRSSLLSLRPFLDRDGVLRVGGRISKAPMPFSFRHPILLSSHPLVTLIIHQTHLRALHAGPQLTLNLLRREFWVIRARNIVKSVIHNCVTCRRERAAIPTQIMGDLPEPRVSAAVRSFLHCGLDYAGPVHIRASAGRGITSRKAYISLFICLATKAIHLELVSDYSTQSFLNAFSRFCARRGLPNTMYSDNGTTFVGADRELCKAYRSAVRDPSFLNSTASDNITWKFIPPSAPHFGGLWEAGVRSVKTHLRRVLGNHMLTFEEFSTLLCRIEACLNSRPISPVSETLDDYEVLTPGHFLIGSAITVNPEPSLLDLQENRLSRWQLLRHITERFWKLWNNDYINTLQQRAKWRKVKPSIAIGQLVLLRNPTLPPCKWELGRVIQCHPGSDGVVRVVTVKTVNSEFKRPTAQICVLPVTSEVMSN